MRLREQEEKARAAEKLSMREKEAQKQNDLRDMMLRLKRLDQIKKNPGKYYKELGLKEGNVTLDELNKSVKALRKFHPDFNPGNPDAVARWQRIEAARDAIKLLNNW